MKLVATIRGSTFLSGEKIARGTTNPGYWVHNSNHPNIRSMLIVESTLLTWSALFDLFFAFEYFYKTQEVVFLVFLYPLISLNQNVICHWGWFELWTQYPGSVVPLAMFTKLKKWYFWFSYRRISGNQNCISFYPQNSYNFALTIS